MAGVFCLGALFSKDWIERQRLAFPLRGHPPGHHRRRAPAHARRAASSSTAPSGRGFSIPAVLSLLGWLHGLYPSVPSAQLYDIQVGRSFVGAALPWNVLGDLSVSIIFPVIGISCLLPGEVSLSLWLFYVLFRVQLLIWASFGIAEGAQSGSLINPRAFINFEEAGGFIALALVVLYQSRKTIHAAFLDLVGRGPEETDPYRRAAGADGSAGVRPGERGADVVGGRGGHAVVGLRAHHGDLLRGAGRGLAAGGGGRRDVRGHRLLPPRGDPAHPRRHLDQPGDAHAPRLPLRHLHV